MKSGRAKMWTIALALLPAAPALSATVVYATSPPEFHIDSKGGTDALAPYLSGINPWGLASDPETGRVYFSDPTGGRIAWIDPSAQTPAATNLINRPASTFHGIAIDSPNRRLFYLDSANDTVNVFHLTTLADQAIVTGGNIVRPNDVAWDAGRGWVWFTDSGGDFVSAIRSWTSSTADRVTFPATDPWGIAVNPQTGAVYYSSYSAGTIRSLDPANGNSAVVVSGLQGPRGLKFDAYGRLFCLESGLNRVKQVQLPGQPVPTKTYTNAENGRAFLIYESDDLDGDHLIDAWERRYSSTLAGLSSASDPDTDGRTALMELLFNGTPQSGADPAPVRSFTRSGGTVTATFQGPREGYNFGAQFSSNLSSWQNYSGTLTKVNLADPLYATWTLSFSPASVGLNPSRVFIRFTGERAAP
ncbi:hypothetical protein OKA04_16275 [Luteolibacter flavescens]|uniref:SMP-30/Gluconolactonase/LRE-like region domain-containing protein n=1 Tax=Luteolibacter flavescens TaxID=1859460 RepID=A0ABT3FRV2_9BACT|nr:hypothetical protein [Luteolibacter flavescens]MCW1886295.1 hypothetical protein [Luteolibacter flavescens]